MNKLFNKLFILFILSVVQVFPQSISRLKAKKAREIQKKLKLEQEQNLEQAPGSDSLQVSILDEKIADIPKIKSPEELIDSLVVELRKKPEKVIKKKLLFLK